MNQVKPISERLQIDAFILIGGRSRRFGHDKAFVNVGGISLTERAAEIIQKAISPRRIILVAATDSQFPGTTGFVSTLPLVFDLYKDRGPFGAVHAALANSQSDWTLILACDYPLVSAELIGHLAGLISDDLDAITPVQPDARVQPLCAFYRVKPCLKVVEESLIKNQSAPPVRSILDHVRTRFVAFDEISHLPGSADFFLNMNTPDDLLRANEIQKLRLESV